MYTMAVINKIEGRAMDIVYLTGNPQTFTKIKDILLVASWAIGKNYLLTNANYDRTK